MSMQLTVTFTGKNLEEIAKHAAAFAEGTSPKQTTGPTPKKKAAAQVEDPTDDEMDMTSFDEVDETEAGEETDDETDFENIDQPDDDEETEAPAPKKKSAKAQPAPAKKAAKITDDQLNKAGIAHAKRHGGRAKTLKVLEKNFGVKSLLEIKDADRAKALKLLGQ